MKNLFVKKLRITEKICAAAVALLMCFGVVAGGMPQRTATADAVTGLQGMIDSAESGATVTLTGDCSDALTVAAGKEITLDLAGHNINARITNNGTLTLADSAGTGAVQITSGESGVQSAIVNNGTLTVDGATVRGTGTGSATEANVVTNNNGAKLYMRGGAIIATSTGTKWGFGINNLSGGVIEEISGGTIESHITNASSGSNALAINNTGTVKSISGGTIVARHCGGGYSTAMRINGGGVVENISGGRIEAKHTGTGRAIGVFMNGGTLRNVSGGTLYAENNGSVQYATALFADNGTVETISGGTLHAYVDNSATSDPKAYGIYVTANGRIKTISGGDIIGRTTAKEWAFGVWNQGVIESIEGGTFSAVIDHGNSSPNAIAVANDKTINSISGGTFYAYSAGPNGGTMGLRTRYAGSSVDSLTGGAVRINKVNNNHYFLVESPGTITYGAGCSLSAATSNSYRYVLASGQTVTEAYKDGDSVMTGTVKASDGSTVKEYKLTGTELASVAYIGSFGYDTVNEAISAASSGATVRIGRDVEQDIEIPAGKKLSIDFAEYKVTGKLTNRGEAKLYATGGGLYKSSTGNGLDAAVYNYGTLTVDGLSVRNDGMNNTAEADGIYNYAGGTLEFKRGSILAVAYGTKWAHAVVNAGTATVSGGNIRSIAFDGENTSNIVALSLIGAGRATVTGGSIYAQGVNKSGTIVGVRTQGTAHAEIKGGAVKAVSAGTDVGCNAFGLLIDNATSNATVSGGVVAAETYADYAFGIWAKGNVDVSGGKIYGAAYHGNRAPNLMGISIEKDVTVNISGGYMYGYSENAASGNTYGVRNRGTLNISGGVFGYNKTNDGSKFVFNDNGTVNYADGMQIVSGELAGIGYAAANTDVAIEQRDGDRFIGVDVYRNGTLVYAYNDYKRDGYVLNGFTAADGAAVSKTDFATMTASATVDAVFGKAPTYLFLGSSVTFGHANHESSFVNYLASMVECRVIKEAVSGTTLTDSLGNSYLTRLINNVPKTEKIDHLIVQLSTNDASRDGVVFGDVTPNDKRSLTDFDKNTTVGAMEYIIAYARQTWGCEVSFYTNPKYTNANYTTLLTLLDKVKAKWDIGVLDFYHYAGMEALDDATLSTYMADAIHPNALGYEWMAGEFAKYLTK